LTNDNYCSKIDGPTGPHMLRMPKYGTALKNSFGTAFAQSFLPRQQKRSDWSKPV